MGRAKVTQEGLVFLAQLLEEGKIIPVIDWTYPLSDIVEYGLNFRKLIGWKVVNYTRNGRTKVIIRKDTQ
jgi:hypothetical protein